MNVHDKANELAKALKESEEVQEITAAMKLVDADPESKRMLEDFRRRQNEIQQRMMTGDMPAQEEMEQMEKSFEVLSLNLSIRRLFEAERRLSTVIEDVNKIIMESLQHLYGGPAN
ncbi:YlbF family regulator [Paenibacillus sp. Marseille-Q4541]|uniref:YlbF family regulator n=1 Tax=Paenibacillus sp. Marseille-Q4541 TaxID=2831522 RepID=UPI001BA87028|nr:YlbF family regulator [Paenibacillus sp. Marseille-Q4541]